MRFSSSVRSQLSSWGCRHRIFIIAWYLSPVLFCLSGLDGRLMLKDSPTSLTWMIFQSCRLKFACLNKDQMNSHAPNWQRGFFFFLLSMSTRQLLMYQDLDLNASSLFSFFSFYLYCFSVIELKLKGMLGSAEKFESLEDMKKIFFFKSTSVSGRHTHSQTDRKQANALMCWSLWQCFRSSKLSSWPKNVNLHIRSRNYLFSDFY